MTEYRNDENEAGSTSLFSCFSTSTDTAPQVDKASLYIDSTRSLIGCGHTGRGRLSPDRQPLLKLS